ncbi:hypothetical protein [Deefgea rivuli]|uniref:hypothetical protein n=1 Tax=Deefgea rivuli TaxID=400948 RepID=UPI0004823AC0|nr:hypothetical protein [Deefgea rivuli]
MEGWQNEWNVGNVNRKLAKAIDLANFRPVIVMSWAKVAENDHSLSLFLRGAIGHIPPAEAEADY